MNRKCKVILIEIVSITFVWFVNDKNNTLIPMEYKEKKSLEIMDYLNKNSYEFVNP